MFSFDILDWYRIVMLLAALYCLVWGGIRYIMAHKYLSRAQHLYISALILFLAGAIIGSVESVTHDDGWRWRLLPSTLAIFLMFAYVLEPIEQSRRRWGRQPYDPKGPGEV